MAASPGTASQPKEPLSGGKSKILPLRNARVDDIQQPLQHYLDMIHSPGSVTADAGKNSIIITEMPERLSRLQTLVEGMDLTYSNSNAMARRMLATQQMMKVLRTLPAENPSTPDAATPVENRPAPLAVTVTIPAPAYKPVSSASFPTETFKPEEQRMHVLEDRPNLRAFMIIGWITDERGRMIVELSNGTQRYLFREGKITEGPYSHINILGGISGIVQGNQLVLKDKSQGIFALNLETRHSGPRP